jgi:ribosome-binding protein aMBF1 (putative translation factor)
VKKPKRRKLEAAGWRVGSADEFLGLTRAESILVDIKLALSDTVRLRRSRAGITQAALARRLNSSQSRIAKVEAADPKVSLDLLVRAALAAGATRSDVARAVGSGRKVSAA